MKTIFIDYVEYKMLSKEVKEKLERTYTSSGGTLPSVIGYTHKECPLWERGDFIDINGFRHQVTEVSSVRLFGHNRESLDPVQQVFLLKLAQ